MVAVSGRLDAVTAPEFANMIRELIESGTPRVVADLLDLSYISSAGVGQILSTAHIMKKKDGQFGLANVGENVRSVFEMCGIVNLLNIHGSVPDALAAIA